MIILKRFFKKIFIEDFLDENIDFNKIKFAEKDLFELLYHYKEKLLKIFKNEIKKDEALEIIKSIILTIKEELKNSKKFINNIGNPNTDTDIDKVKNTIISKLYRIYLIKKFLEEQDKKFSYYQKQTYDDFKNTTKQILEKSECLENVLKKFMFVDEENLFRKWVETKPGFDEKFLNEYWMADIIKDLIDSVRLDINYISDEKFVLWMIKNDFSQYLKNDF